MAFKIGNILNKETLEQGRDTHRVQYLDYKLIKPNENNSKYYSLTGIDALACGIADKGLLEPLVVVKNDDNTYTIISGHRRYAAITMLIENGNENFKLIPCIVRDADMIDDEMLIDGNVFNRQLSPAQRAKELNVKMRMLKERKDRGEKIPGKLLEIIARDMDISYHQAKKLNSINLNASENTKEAFEQGKLSVEAAYELSKTDTQVQDDILNDAAKNDTEVTVAKVKKAVKSDEKSNSTNVCQNENINNTVSEASTPKNLSENNSENPNGKKRVTTPKQAVNAVNYLIDNLNSIDFKDENLKNNFLKSLKLVYDFLVC